MKKKQLAPQKREKNDVTRAIQLKLHERMNKKQIWRDWSHMVVPKILTKLKTKRKPIIAPARALQLKKNINIRKRKIYAQKETIKNLSTCLKNILKKNTISINFVITKADERVSLSSLSSHKNSRRTKKVKPINHEPKGKKLEVKFISYENLAHQTIKISHSITSLALLVNNWKGNTILKSETNSTSCRKKTPLIPETTRLKNRKIEHWFLYKNKLKKHYLDFNLCLHTSAS